MGVDEYIKMYRNAYSIYMGIFNYGDELKMFVKLVNGTEVIESDESWTCAESAIVYDNLFYGEIYDDRINNRLLYTNEMPHRKYAAQTTKAPAGKIRPQRPGDKVMEIYKMVYENGMTKESYYQQHVEIKGLLCPVCTEKRWLYGKI